MSLTDCDYSIGVASGGIKDVTMTSSSSINASHTVQSAKPRLITGIGSPGSGWIPALNDSKPWLQADLGELYTVRGIVTQGCGDQLAWVKEYCLSFIDQKENFAWYGGFSAENCQVLI